MILTACYANAAMAVLPGWATSVLCWVSSGTSKFLHPRRFRSPYPLNKQRKELLMSPAENVVTVVWDTWLKSGAEAEGLRLTRQVWSDMRSFDGYVSHQILIDQDAPGHIIALAKWRSREDADAVREKYKDSETIRRLTPLLARPRDRWVTSEDG